MQTSLNSWKLDLAIIDKTIKNRLIDKKVIKSDLCSACGENGTFKKQTKYLNCYYKCKHCHRTFSNYNNTALKGLKVPLSVFNFLIEKYIEDLPFKHAFKELKKYYKTLSMQAIKKHFRLP